jgi:DUF4097 and DUF4098 domain-containing protein YvlB
MLTTLVMAAMLTAPALPQTDTVVPVREGAELIVELLRGEVVVRTWNRNEVRVEADHEEDDWVDIEHSDRLVQIEVGSRYGPPDDIDMAITIPTWMDIAIEGAFVEVDLEGVGGEVAVETAHGEVRLVGGRDFIKLYSVQGEVECRNASGRIQIGSVNGGVQLIDATGDISAETVNGELEMSGITSTTVDATAVNGEIFYEGTITDGGRYVFNSHNGDVTVAVPEGTNASVWVSTYNGDFETDFPVTLRETRAQGKRLNFTLGSGGARLELNTFGGDIHLRRP